MFLNSENSIFYGLCSPGKFIGIMYPYDITEFKYPVVNGSAGADKVAAKLELHV
jgi:hypothetical protein